MHIKNITLSFLTALCLIPCASASDVLVNETPSPRATMPLAEPVDVSVAEDKSVSTAAKGLRDAVKRESKAILKDAEGIYEEDVAPVLKKIEQDTRHTVKPVLKDAGEIYKEDVAPTLKKAEQDVRHAVNPALKKAEKKIKKALGKKKKK